MIEQTVQAVSPTPSTMLTLQYSFHEKLLFMLVCLKKIVNTTLTNQAPTLLNESLANNVREACALNNVIFDGNIFEKVEQLSKAMDHTAGIILVGDSFGGKSTILKVLAATLKLSTKVMWIVLTAVCVRYQTRT